jgi:hypothetical protein
VQQVNIVLASLGKQPFEAVYETVKAIKDQGDPQVNTWREAHPDEAKLVDVKPSGNEEE